MTSRCCKGLDALLAANRGGGARVIGSISVVLGDYQPGTKYLTLHVDNPKGLVEHEKGKGLGLLATTLVPELVEKEVYSGIKTELEKQFKEKGSTVTVDITQTPPKGGKLGPVVTREGVFVGILLAALGYGAVRLVKGLL